MTVIEEAVQSLRSLADGLEKGEKRPAEVVVELDYWADRLTNG